MDDAGLVRQGESQPAAAAADGLVLISFFGRAGAVLVGSDNRAVDHRIFVIGVGARGWNTLCQTPLLAQRLNRRWVFFQPPKRSGRSRRGIPVR
jgi:hypothetical protein